MGVGICVCMYVCVFKVKHLTDILLVSLSLF